MVEDVKCETTSRRRMLSLLGIAAALSFAVPAVETDAQTAGMERRKARRQRRVERRYQRRTGKPAQTQPAQNPSAPAAPPSAATAPSSAATAPPPSATTAPKQ